MARTTERAEIIAALGLEPEGRGKSDRYNMTLDELRHKLKTQGARSKASSKPDRVTESDVKAALDVLRQDYWQDVRGLGDDLLRRIKEGEIGDEEDLDQRLHEDVDGSQRIIYTQENITTLLSSDNSDAYIEEYGELPEGRAEIPWAQLAYAAFCRDVSEYIGAQGYDFERGD